ncbi:MAG: hypothetical protein ACF8TS_13475 [Maioricimonas sp. JB049]
MTHHVGRVGFSFHPWSTVLAGADFNDSSQLVGIVGHTGRKVKGDIVICLLSAV